MTFTGFAFPRVSATESTEIASPRRTSPFHFPDDVAADAEALARAEGKSLNETVKSALIEAVESRRNDPESKKSLKKIIEQDRGKGQAQRRIE